MVLVMLSMIERGLNVWGLHWAQADLLVGKRSRVALLSVKMQELLRMGDTDRKSGFLYTPVLLRSSHTCHEIYYVTDEDDESIQETNQSRCCDM